MELGARSVSRIDKGGPQVQPVIYLLRRGARRANYGVAGENYVH